MAYFALGHVCSSKVDPSLNIARCFAKTVMDERKHLLPRLWSTLSLSTETKLLQQLPLVPISALSSYGATNITLVTSATSGSLLKALLNGLH
jgi:hypothetical protein